MGKSKQVLAKLNEIAEQLDRIEGNDTDGLSLDDQIMVTAKKLEALCMEKCEREGVSAMMGNSSGMRVGMGVSTGPLNFFAGPDPDIPDSVPSDWQ